VKKYKEVILSEERQEVLLSEEKQEVSLSEEEHFVYDLVLIKIFSGQSHKKCEDWTSPNLGEP
jgi:hypothetical protein